MWCGTVCNAHQIGNFNVSICHRSIFSICFKTFIMCAIFIRVWFFCALESLFSSFFRLDYVTSKILECAIHIKHHLINYCFIKCIIFIISNNSKLYKWIYVLVFTRSTSFHLSLPLWIWCILNQFNAISFRFIGIVSFAFILSFHDFYSFSLSLSLASVLLTFGFHLYYNSHSS